MKLSQDTIKLAISSIFKVQILMLLNAKVKDYTELQSPEYELYNKLEFAFTELDAALREVATEMEKKGAKNE